MRAIKTESVYGKVTDCVQKSIHWSEVGGSGMSAGTDNTYMKGLLTVNPEIRVHLLQNTGYFSIHCLYTLQVIMAIRLYLRCTSTSTL